MEKDPMPRPNKEEQTRPVVVKAQPNSWEQPAGLVKEQPSSVIAAGSICGAHDHPNIPCRDHYHHHHGGWSAVVAMVVLCWRLQLRPVALEPQKWRFEGRSLVPGAILQVKDAILQIQTKVEAPFVGA